MPIPEPSTWRACLGQGFLQTDANHTEQKAVLHTLFPHFERACHVKRAETAFGV
jgi:hypothetical protein